MKIETLEVLLEAAKNLGAEEVMFREPGGDGDRDELKKMGATIESHGNQHDSDIYLVVFEKFG